MATKTLNLTDELYEYMLNTSLRESSVLQELRRETSTLSNSIMQISPEQGQFMRFLVELIGAEKTLEIGTFTGYSALSAALALPEDGQVIACDINTEWTEIAKKYWKKAGVDRKISLKLAPAEETLRALISSKQSNSFDFAFIDADKTSYDTYYELCLVLLRKGGLMLIDNVFRSGNVVDPDDNQPETCALRSLNEKILKDERVSISMLPVSDGITLAVKR